MKAKEFPDHHVWFNAQPLTVKRDLRGKLVLIDFWTYCCINCLHVLPDLEFLEQKFSGENAIVFMGCHSAKFVNEKGAEKVRDAILKYEIKHPVVNDDKMLVWRNFERRSWPSLIVLSPESVPILILTGEGHRQVLDLFLSVAYDFYYERLDHTCTIKWQPEEQKEIAEKQKRVNQTISETEEEIRGRGQNLRYPGKLLCVEKQAGLDHNLIVVSDTANNRLVIINEETMEFEEQIGNGKIGLVDGYYNEAQFHHPQGLCHVFRENQHFVYLCDTKNHAIREINLSTKEVLTVIGTGEKGFDKEGNKSPETQRLSSPWDIVAVNRDTLIFAMAGTHQIWALNLKTNRGFNFSGSGREGNLNSKSDLKACEWAQPSGLAIGLISASHIELYVADSESSAIRSVNMKSLKSSRNLVGGDNNPRNLHAYGDTDGVGVEAKLQHPLGVHFIPEKNVIIVTDTYNHKIKVVDPFRNEIFSWLGSGKNRLRDETTFKACFNEPSGVSSLYDEERRDVKVYICDTNNHCIRRIYYDVGVVETPRISGVPSCASGECVQVDQSDSEVNANKEHQIQQREQPANDGKNQGLQCNEDGTCVAPSDWLE